MANFRTMSPPTALTPAATTAGVPQTGLGILMSGNAFNRPVETTVQNARMNMSPEQQRDLADRERQAQSLAAAGMVAETVGRGSHAGAMNGPPALPTATSDLSSGNVVGGVLDSHNWGMPDTDATLEDMEMDFANLFDPAHEMESMQTEGSGWPLMGNENGTSMSPTPAGTQHSTNERIG